MRVWEFEDSKVIPSDLVREQDFIMRIRRMQRQGGPHLVLNFVLNAIDPLAKSQTALEDVQKKLSIFAKNSNGTYHEMSNGDAFLTWENGDPRILAAKAVEAALKEYAALANQFLLVYRMPEGYTTLRERTNHYIEVVRAAAAVGGPQTNEARGALTARNLDQIEQIIDGIDLRRYGRTQSFYRRAGMGWQQAGEEFFVSFEDLRRERFPKLEVGASEHFFFALCSHLDQKLLAMLTESYETIGGKTINLNLSITTIVSPVFAQFVRRVPRDHRPLVGFELHRGDLFQDFSLTLSAIDVLKREGFRVIIDAVTPDMVNYINFGSFSVDGIKINVSKDRAMQLADPVIRASLEKLPSSKMIFFRCDNERALDIGRDLGVPIFQGWLIDDLTAKKA